MDQKVKLQITSNLSDVPTISALMLQEAVMDSSKLLNILEQAVTSLKHTDPLNEDEREKLKANIEMLAVSQSLLAKLDARINDTATIIAGLISIFEKPSSTEEQKDVKDDSVVTG